MSRLGRREPTDWKHVSAYPLSALATEDVPVGQPIVLGINWYSDFDEPVRKSDGTYWIGVSGNLGQVRGGHAICVRPDRLTDYGTWWEFYDQQENSCVGFSASRMQTLRNRRKYDAPWLYHQALKIDEWPGEADEGTSVRAGMEILRTQGVRKPGATYSVLSTSGILAYRWLANVDEVRTVVASPSGETRGAVRLLNSWGKAYPHFVWLPYEVLERLLNENGEAVVATNL